MAKIIAPNRSYSGVSAGVVFYDGEGQCEDVRLLDWFEVHGYQVIYADKPRDSETEESIEEKAEEKIEQEVEEQKVEEKIEQEAEEQKVEEKPKKKGK